MLSDTYSNNLSCQWPKQALSGRTLTVEVANKNYIVATAAHVAAPNEYLVSIIHLHTKPA